MLDHVGFVVLDYARSHAFYTAVLKPLGYGLVMEVTAEQSGGGAHAGFGPDHTPAFWIGTGDTALNGRLHVCFRAKDRASVDAFHAAALSAGATNNGAPGLRSHYHENYYAAFVLDPDGHNIEACCHAPE